MFGARHERERLVEEARRLSGVVEPLALMTGTADVYVLDAGSGKDDISRLAFDLDELGLEVVDEYLVRNHVRQPFSSFQFDPVDRSPRSVRRSRCEKCSVFILGEGFLPLRRVPGVCIPSTKSPTVSR